MGGTALEIPLCSMCVLWGVFVLVVGGRRELE